MILVCLKVFGQACFLSESKMKLICLSRAPLDYLAGIPKFCSTLYQSINRKVVVTNYSLKQMPGSIVKCIDHSADMTEYTFKSQLTYKTFGISLGYFKFILRESIQGDVLFHSQHPDPFTAFCLVFAKSVASRNVRIIVTWHAEIYLAYFFAAPFLLILDFLLFLFSDVIVFPTLSHYRSSLFRHLPFLQRKVKIIPFGLLPASRVSFADRITSAIPFTQPVYFLSIGRLVSYKGYEDALKAFSIIKPVTSNFFYNIIGNGPLLDRLQKLIYYYRLDNNVSIRCGIDDVEKVDYLRTSSCLLLPSVSQAEAFGFVQLEAFNSGLPVVNTQLNNGVNELAPSSHVITVPPHNPKLLADCLMSIIYRPNCLDELSLLSYERASSYTLDSMVNSYLQVFDLVSLSL